MSSEENHSSFKRAVAYSLLLHVLLLSLFYLDLPSIKSNTQHIEIIKLNLVNVSDITNLKPSAQQSPIKKEIVIKRQEKPSEKERSVKEIKSNPKSLTQNSNAAEPATNKISSIEKNKSPENEMLPIFNENKDRNVVKDIKPQKQNVEKPDKKNAGDKILQEKKVIEQKNKKSSNAILKNLKADRSKSKTKVDERKKESNILENKLKELMSVNDELGDLNEDFDPDLEMSISEVQSIRAQITKAWNTVSFGGSGKVMKVILLIQLDKTGEVLKVEPVLENSDNPSYKAFVDSVIRAAHKASPLMNLPINKFQLWKNIELTFSSEDMVY